MRDAGDIRISRAIVHIVDHHQGDPVLSQVELELTNHAKLVAYFEAQVRNALGDPAAGAADFKPEGTGASELCAAVLDNPARFVELSQNLARLLFQAMGKDQRISVGSLAACLYTGSEYPGESCLGLLKIDPSEMLAQRVLPLAQGQQVTLDVVENVMPTARERLQKAALVRQHGKGDYDLILLDRQTEKLAADFFAGGFLGAQPKLDELQHTKALYLGLQAASTRMIEKAVLPPDRAEWFRNEIQSAVTGRSFNLDEWLQRVPLPEGAAAVIGGELAKKVGPDREFKLDVEMGKQLTEKRRLRGDFGLYMEIESEHWDDVVQSVQEVDGGKVLRLRLEVHNPRWVRK
ncbi:MAG TPA: nucleoid-associated protein [Thermoanaerobaculia bacterium]|nr:nucleoid-associated protein [Thermoanaerobaculia bacterium]